MPFRRLRSEPHAKVRAILGMLNGHRKANVGCILMHLLPEPHAFACAIAGMLLMHRCHRTFARAPDRSGFHFAPGSEKKKDSGLAETRVPILRLPSLSGGDR